MYVSYRRSWSDRGEFVDCVLAAGLSPPAYVLLCFVSSLLFYLTLLIVPGLFLFFAKGGGDFMSYLVRDDEHTRLTAFLFRFLAVLVLFFFVPAGVFLTL